MLKFEIAINITEVITTQANRTGGRVIGFAFSGP